MHENAFDLIASKRNPRVLLVEDDADLRDALAEALTESGLDVTTAVDGSDGLGKLRDVRPDVVVLDLMMPKLDGWQFRVAQRRDPVLARHLRPAPWVPIGLRNRLKLALPIAFTHPRFGNADRKYDADNQSRRDHVRCASPSRRG